MRNFTPKSLLNRKGQVAIFVALIFQVLFLFFAMIINVGLLVHHKVNLQNSVDLAAYYGAMKQAEMLNGIGHINYQIRQSWKLLAWRYRLLGTSGDYLIHPYDKSTRVVGAPDAFGGDAEGYPQGLTGNQKDFYEVPAFCITYSPFTPMPGNESTCKDQSSLKSIGFFQPPPNIAGFMDVNRAIQEAAVKSLDAALSRCKFVGQFNYMILAQFMVAFNFDQGERKQLINLLSRGLSEKEDDFRELSGEYASLGMQKTLENNLTEANRASLKMKISNGLGHQECNAVGMPPESPPKWLSEIKISPAFMYMDSLCSRRGLVPEVKQLTSAEPDLPQNRIELAEDINRLKNYVDPLKAPYNSSIGFEKNPWCMSYVGVSAETTPKIPFALGGVTLKARSYAKPFGGKIGPWYMSQWASGSAQSSGGKRIDPLLPWRDGDANNQAGFKDPTRSPNYSRFVGDTAGLKSRAVQGQWARAIYNISTAWSGKASSDPDALPEDKQMVGEPNFFHWGHLGQSLKAGKTGDILAWDAVNNAYPKMRNLEIAAILPDQFDLTYYSIEPDFYHNYYLKIANEYVKNVPGFTYLVRPDLGSRLGDKEREEFSVKEQFNILKHISTNDPQIAEPKVDFDTKLLYVVKDVHQVLTSWVGTDYLNYSLDQERFGKCINPIDKDSPPAPGNCVVGGRTGYSVKIVSSNYLRSQDLELGGEGAGPGKLLNPPDDNF